VEAVAGHALNGDVEQYLRVPGELDDVVDQRLAELPGIRAGERREVEAGLRILTLEYLVFMATIARNNCLSHSDVGQPTGVLLHGTVRLKVRGSMYAL
jgi:hypothetical protein